MGTMVWFESAIHASNFMCLLLFLAVTTRQQEWQRDSSCHTDHLFIRSYRHCVWRSKSDFSMPSSISERLQVSNLYLLWCFTLCRLTKRNPHTHTHTHIHRYTAEQHRQTHSNRDGQQLFCHHTTDSTIRKEWDNIIRVGARTSRMINITNQQSVVYEVTMGEIIKLAARGKMGSVWVVGW